MQGKNNLEVHAANMRTTGLSHGWTGCWLLTGRKVRPRYQVAGHLASFVADLTPAWNPVSS
jgi:hypothetical protein